ncbi:pentatricopeptide repeat-containing protein At4g36680, mitochondrial [Arachis duranensis]|uniref:Pentatricopeptide repeat-containing protein At4g36680, mitochondrial n=1 Tax=Arachis duranensis TaxID=130453 RepID=A0A9C6TX21_ARADU|nr:pentatricopeptide repeat-containing protein At4g36680, mitochondrial [Arachis duranensis]XP_052118690.1 pentatricopeptide repeat-containing protein At4g36680, mitochondrial [Arachis duranensis]XP_052118691.1 pentatricopeptide repeat-containing protein At4g36680, mitochondrial [Arachis duranensis]
MPPNAAAALAGLRRLCTTTDAATITISRAKSQLRSEFDPDKALQIYSSVSKHYSSPVTSRYALDLTIRRLAKCRRHSDIVDLIESQKSDPKVASEPFLSTLIRSYGIADMFDRALQTYHQMDTFGTPRTSVSFNALLTACVNCALYHNAPHLFDEIPKQYGVVPDKVSYGILAKSFCRIGDPAKALQVLKDAQGNGVVITAVTYTTILDVLFRKGKIDEAEKLWRLMEETGCVDVTAYNMKLKFLTAGGGGLPEKVNGLIDEMVKARFMPDTISYNYLMTCYFKNGMVEEAKKVYDGLRGKQCRPNAATFRTVVYFLCRNEDFEGGYRVFKESAKVNKIPDFNTMKILVEGLVKKGKKKEAEELIRTVKKRFPCNMLNAWAKVERNLNLVSDDGADNVESKKDSEP